MITLTFIVVSVQLWCVIGVTQIFDIVTDERREWKLICAETAETMKALVIR